MTDPETEDEPSIEEILSSIRQIIADDDDEAGADDSTDENDNGSDASEESDDDVIDLTQTVESAEEEPEEEIDLAFEDQEPEEDVEEIAPAPPPEPEPAAAAPPPPPPAPKPVKEPETTKGTQSMSDKDSILGDSGESAALDGFKELVRRTAVEHNGVTIEEIVRTELRPLLKGWLDSNLPSLIERLVKEELERVSKRALGED